MRSRCLLAGLLLCLAGPAHAVEAEREALAELRALVTGLDAKPVSARAAVVRAIVDKGPVGAACVLELRADFRKAAHVDVFSESLRRLRHPQFESYLLAVIVSTEPIEEKHIAFERCAQYGSRTIVVPFARSMAANQGREKMLAERTFVSLLKRLSGADVFESISKVLGSLDSKTRGRVIASVANTGSPNAQSFLSGALGRYPELDFVVISGIARIPPAHFDDRLARRVRGYLGADDVNLRREAAMVLGRWRDHRSVERIIALLEDEDPSVLKNAQWALARITGLAFPPDHQRWSHWYETETTWWEGDGLHYIKILQSKRDGDVIASLLEMGKRNYAPEGLDEHLFALLDDRNAEIDTIAKRLIARFGLRDPRAL